MTSPRTALRAGQVLTVTADAVSSGFAIRSAPSGSTTAYPASEVAASATVVIGPFSTDRQYEIVSLAGQLNYTISDGEPTATSAGLAAAVSDETGSGPAVFATAPTITTPLITQPIVAAAADGAVSISPVVVVATKAGVCAMTLAAPTAGQAGTIMTFVAGTANAHTLTATGLIDDGITGGSKNLATFAAFVGASLTLMAYNLKWVVLSKNAVTIS
jgi:uncharacterized membrane protein YeaQ/YmgE (transglycosylase-associated protein family)